jgi:hypothetical protein
MSPLLALSRYPAHRTECPLSGAKRTSCRREVMSAFDPKMRLFEKTLDENAFVQCLEKALKAAA